MRYYLKASKVPPDGRRYHFLNIWEWHEVWKGSPSFSNVEMANNYRLKSNHRDAGFAQEGSDLAPS
jgi:hypothetical protein